MKTPHGNSNKFALISGAVITILFMMSCKILSSSTPAANGSQQTTSQAFDLTAGLDQLHSYHVEFLQADQGQLDGKPYQNSNKISRSVVVQPFAEDSTIDDHPADGSPFYLQFVRIGDEQYFQKKDGGACQGTLNSQQSGQIPNPVELLPSISTAEKLKAESLNGTQVTHYRFDASGLGLGARTASGEMWIADQDGLVVKYQLEIQPPDKLTGKGVEARQSIYYELTSINQLDQIALPTVCVPVLVDIPAMPDASGLERRSASMSFTTTSDPSQVAAFYDQALPPLEWQASSESNQTLENGLIYNKDKQSLSITFFQGERGLNVDVLLIDPTYQFTEVVAAERATTEPGTVPTQQPTPTFDMAQSGLPEDVPLYPGASQIVTANGMGITFQTGDSMDQVNKFYTEQLKGNGWNLAANNKVSGTITQTWTKSKTTLTLSIQDLGDKCNVLVMAVSKP